jgi:hypothetical protein
MDSCIRFSSNVEAAVDRAGVADAGSASVARPGGLLRRLSPYSPVLLAAAIMLPRLASAQFGLFDDGRTLSVARAIVGGDFTGIWEPASGRSRPVYWLFNAATYRLAGPSPVAYFLANAALMMLITAGLILLVRKLGGTRLQAGLVGAAFVVSGPIVESFYTLSKPEPVQLAWMVLVVVLCTFVDRANAMAGRVAILLAALIAALLSDLSKETSLLAIPIGFAWLLIAWWGRKQDFQSIVWPRAVGFAIATVLAGVAFVILRIRFSILDIPTTTYAGKYAFTLQRMLASGIRWGGWLAWDSAYLIPLGIWAVYLARSRRSSRLAGAIAASGVWMLCWFLFYLPWMYGAEYYLLPLATGGAVLGGIALGTAVEVLMSRGRGKERVWGAICLGAFLPLLLASLANAVSTARVQLAMDGANSSLLGFLQADTPKGTLVVVNIQDPNEYFDEMGMQLSRILNRPDLVLEPFSSQPELRTPDPTRERYVVVPVLRNEPSLSVRMGIIEGTTKRWNESLYRFFGSLGAPAFSSRRQFRLLTFDFPRVLCFVARSTTYCAEDRPFIDFQVFEYGWDVFRLPQARAQIHPDAVLG